ncbi:primase-like DNA-binding domain-containing protein, partial [Thomasclavelia cocleata]
GSIVYSHYQSWCKTNGYATTSNRTFYQDLKDKGIIINSGKINGKLVRNRLNYYVLANPLEFDNLL